MLNVSRVCGPVFTTMVPSVKESRKKRLDRDAVAGGGKNGIKAGEM